MTNREWLLTLTDEELAHFIIWEAPRIGQQWTASDHGLMKWLKSEKEKYNENNLRNKKD